MKTTKLTLTENGVKRTLFDVFEGDFQLNPFFHYSIETQKRANFYCCAVNLVYYQTLLNKNAAAQSI